MVAPASALSPSRLRLSRTASPWWLGVPFLALVLSPPLALVVRALGDLASGDVGAFGLVVPSARRLGLLGSSVLLACAVACAVTIVGTLAALGLQRLRGSRYAGLRWLVIALAPVPPYIHALAWCALGTHVNRALHLSQSHAIPVEGWVAAFWVQSMALLPLAVGLALIGI